MVAIATLVPVQSIRDYFSAPLCVPENQGMHPTQRWNRVTTADPNDPLTQTAIQVRPGFDPD